MENKIKSTPKDVFLHLFNIVTFYLSVIGFITLYIQYINATFPDALNYFFTNIANSVRWASSILFVAVPSFILSYWLLEKDLKKTPEKRNLKLRKWLIYFTLFISAITIIIDLMVFVYNFLDGELTVRFILKVLTVLIVAGAVFGFYMWELKRENKKSQLPKILAVICVIVVLGSIIVGFFIVGTPMEQRNRRMDDQRIQDLQVIQGQIIEYWINKKTLPQNLDLLKSDITGFNTPTNPDTKLPYIYQIKGELEFELCAEFITDDAKYPEFDAKDYPRSYDYQQQNWRHGLGNTCFTRTIDPDLYKNVTPMPAEKMMY